MTSNWNPTSVSGGQYLYSELYKKCGGKMNCCNCFTCIYSVDSGDDNGKDELKSEISLVHEIALKRNLSVNFEVRFFKVLIQNNTPILNRVIL